MRRALDLIGDLLPAFLLIAVMAAAPARLVIDLTGHLT